MENRVYIFDERWKSDEVQVWEPCANCGSFPKNLEYLMSFQRRRATDCLSQVARHRETKSHKVPEWLQLFNEGLSGEPPESHTVVVEQLVVGPRDKKHLMK